MVVKPRGYTNQPSTLQLMVNGGLFILSPARKTAKAEVVQELQELPVKRLVAVRDGAKKDASETMRTMEQVDEMRTHPQQ